LQACRSAFARADQRVAERHLALYARLVLALRHSAAVSADETGWKVAGDNAWLWVFTPESVTVYAIDPHRSHEVAAQVLGEDFAGVLQCDCFLAYDALADRQQKCLQHLTRRCDEIAESKSERAVQFSHQVATLLRGAIHLRHRSQDGKISPHGYEVACGRLEAAVDRLLAKNLTAGDNARLAKLLKKHRERLFVFLYESGVRPTHAAAEQEIRPAVAVRKTSACNRSWVGAKTPAVLTSVMRTCRKHGVDFIALTMERLRNRKALLPEWVTRLLPVATAHPAIGPPSS
jgi:hypothetical protein